MVPVDDFECPSEFGLGLTRFFLRELHQNPEGTVEASRSTCIDGRNISGRIECSYSIPGTSNIPQTDTGHGLGP